jgi:hypothetical protein
MNELRDRQLVTEAALDRLVQHIDRLLDGRSGNGGQPAA